jgi:hypothetical protein
LSTGFAVGLVQNPPEWVVSPVLTLFSGRHFMHVRRALALTIAVPVLLAGCSDDPEPTPKIPEPTSSSPSPSPTETDEPEAESPEEFVRRWVEVGDEMQMTGKVAKFRQMSRGCVACADLIKNVERIYESGGSIAFDGTEIVHLKSRSKRPPTFELDLDTPTTRVLDASGSEEQTFPAGIGKYLLTLDEEGDGWRVTHYGRR